MNSHAARGSQCRQDGGEDADEGLDDELPDVLLGVGHGFGLGYFRYVGDHVGNRLLDELLQKLGVANQQAILDRLKRAQNLGLIDFKVDNDIFRHTSGYDKKEKRYGPVYELRVREPKEIRIYFQYIDNLYYVLSMGGKGANQNADIGLAFERIKQIREI